MVHAREALGKQGARWAALVTLLGMLLVAACTPIQAPTPAPAAEIPEITLQISDGAISVPEVVPGGIVEIRVENADSQPRTFNLWRIREGHTRDEITALAERLAANPEEFFGVFDLANFIHFLDGIAPGGSDHFYADLRTGEFFVSDDTQPQLPPIFFAANEIVGTVAPETAVTVDMADFAYVMPDSLPAGKHWWEFTNSGEQWHLAAIIKAAPDVSMEELMAAFEFQAEPNPDGPVQVFGGKPPLSPGERVWIELKLAAGEYELVCPLPDLTSFGTGGPPMTHLDHGMRRAFSVTN